MIHEVTACETTSLLLNLQKQSKVWTFKDDSKPGTEKRQRAMINMFFVFFRSTGLVKDIKREEQKVVASNWYTNKY